MRKKTALRTRKRQKASSPQQSGLIAREKNARQSAVTKSALDNRFHRTSPRLRCGATRLPGGTDAVKRTIFHSAHINATDRGRQLLAACETASHVLHCHT